MGCFAKFIERPAEERQEKTFLTRFLQRRDDRPLVSRRRVARVRCLESATVEGPHGVLEGYVTDLSTSGMRFETTAEVEPGQRLKVRLDGSPPVKARIAWVQRGIAGSTCGLWFCECREILEVSWVGFLLRQKTDGRHRVHPRHELRLSCNIPARITEVNAIRADIPGVLTDLSLGGALLTCNQQLPEGTVAGVSWRWREDSELSLAARLTRSRARSSLYLLHLRFLGMDNAETAELRDCLAHLTSVHIPAT